MNEYRFRINDLNELTSVNYGVVVLGSCYQDSESNYYGRLQDVGVKVDRNRITTVDIKSVLRSNDIFVLASQETQVYYAPNVVNS